MYKLYLKRSKFANLKFGIEPFYASLKCMENELEPFMQISLFSFCQEIVIKFAKVEAANTVRGFIS